MITQVTVQPTMIDLSDPTLRLAVGGGRVVFQHPGNPTSIVKVHRDPYIEPGLIRRLRPSTRRFGPFRESYVEYKHYVAAMNRHGSCPEYLPEFRGFVDTTLGIGQVFQKVSDDGSEDLAPTVAKVIASGRFDGERLVAEIREFFAAIKRDRVIFRDLRVENICVVHDAEGGIRRIIAVDGLGDFTLFPMRSIFATAYDTWHAKAERKFLAAIPLAAPS